MAVTGREGDDDVDHYEVLRLPSGEEGAALSVERIDKAYRTQSRLRHPDDPNATADFQSLASSSTPASAAAARAAATGAKRRKAVSDLEERERAFAARGGLAVHAAELAKREEKRMAADIQRTLDEHFAPNKSCISGVASTSAHGDKKGGTPENGPKTENDKILKVSWEGGADYYTAAKLDEIFKQFGTVEDIVIMFSKSKSKGSALVVMVSKEAARSALKNHSVYNVFPIPLSVAPVPAK
uniref:Pre-mRNA-splicing factor cwc23 n=1 Tax=Aegilops tauschii TaxID=37682 RepID=N1R1E8_AEGTA